MALDRFTIGVVGSGGDQEAYLESGFDRGNDRDRDRRARLAFGGDVVECSHEPSQRDRKGEAR